MHKQKREDSKHLKSVTQTKKEKEPHAQGSCQDGVWGGSLYAVTPVQTGRTYLQLKPQSP